MDATLSLAITLTNTKGATALLLGSGISSAAGIPTGWGITLDLVQKAAAVAGQSAGPDPAAWYQANYGEEPDYAKLVERFAPTPAERQRLLRSYFVPTEEERELGLKVPTKAHHAIAELVAKGYIKVILTTNFDSLLEQALEAQGVQPAVVSDASALAGMMPLQHEQVTIIKLHGHYLDTRLRNTPHELATYEPALNQLLDRVFDEYGLLICGWSGVWDTALREALLRCPTRRFTTYWAVMGGLAAPAQVLAKQRAAQLISIPTGADSFFQSLAEKVAALEDLAQSHPATTAVAVATLKRYLLVDASRIRLHELVTAEVEHVWEQAGTLTPAASPTLELIAQTVRSLDKLCERVIQLLVTGSYWAGTAHQTVWLQSVTRLSKLKVENTGSYGAWMNLRDYPLLLAFYAVGLGATAANDDSLLLALLLDVKLRKGAHHEIEKPHSRLYEPIEAHYLTGLYEQEKPFLIHYHLHQVLRPTFREILPDDFAYDELFDRFEYLVSLAFYNEMIRANDSSAGDFRYGRFMQRSRWNRPNPAIEEIRQEITAAGTSWPMLQRGLFNKSEVELGQVVAKMDSIIKEMRSFR
ncbi:hypothetical protein GCM10027422_34320 [Hymenobacter arcticus]